MKQAASRRDETLRRAASLERIDVLVIGAGINGAGTFRDLCLNRVECLLVDAEDFGAGATSASTRIAHGGLRYLENGEVRLVTEATRERNRLLRNAPHYVSPLLITIPSFSWFGGLLGTLGKPFGVERPMRSRGLALVKVGLIIYDYLGLRHRALPRHAVAGRHRAERLVPGLNPAICGIASYYDARISHAERIALELVTDGLAACPGSIALNHCRVAGVEGADVVIVDEETGERFAIRPRVVVNASGAWIDVVNGCLGRGNARLIGGTKGSHILLDNPRLREAMGERCFSYDDGQGRMCVAYVLGSLVLLGSSDIRVDDPGDAVCSDEEVDYFLRTIRIVFPAIDVDRAQVRYRFCGVRPLPFADVKDTVNISRDHSIHRNASAGSAFAVLSLIGGKWTTFRAFAEQAADRVLDELGRTRTRSTHDIAIGGGAAFPRRIEDRRRWIAETRSRTGLGTTRLETLLDRYGSAASRVACFCASQPDTILPGAPSYSEREMRYLIRCEMVRTLEDLIYRRTMLALSGELSFVLLSRLASIVADEIGRGSSHATMDLLGPAIARLSRENGIDFTADLQRTQDRPMTAALGR